ncbi:HPr family phosphocarrier protein [Paenibacillus chartarius]|uniref:HPr family phosphocarrier protein n=1 Tax=Paenibacillus chartarius TaxID=747481 RepID=A0ABV6DTE7_9BACL
MSVSRRIQLPPNFTLKQTLDFVEAANRFKSNVSFHSNGYLLNCKGVLGMVSFCLQFQSRGELQLIIDGPDEEEANAALESLLHKAPVSPGLLRKAL